MNRQQFAVSQACLKPLLPVLREGFKYEWGVAGGFICAKTYLWHHAMVFTPDGWQVMPDKMMISVGELSPVVAGAVAVAGDGYIRYSRDATAGEAANPGDRVLLLTYDTQSGKAFMSTYGQYRSAGEYFLTIGATPGHSYQATRVFTDAGRGACTESVYLRTAGYDPKLRLVSSGSQQNIMICQ